LEKLEPHILGALVVRVKTGEQYGSNKNLNIKSTSSNNSISGSLFKRTHLNKDKETNINTLNVEMSVKEKTR
jgi:hypothetical protein